MGPNWIPIGLEKCVTLAQAMGSCGWCQCLHCTYWVYNPYLFDPDGTVLCNWCWDFVITGEGEADSPAHWWSNRQCTARAIEAGRLLPGPVLALGDAVQSIADCLKLRILP